MKKNMQTLDGVSFQIVVGKERYSKQGVFELEKNEITLLNKSRPRV